MKIVFQRSMGNTAGREVGSAGRDSAIAAETCQKPDSFWCVIGKGHLGWLLWNCTSAGLP